MKIWKLEVSKFAYREKRNWLKEAELEEFDYIDDDKTQIYTIYFPYFKNLSKYIDEITEGHNQYWADAYEQTDGDEESLEYHNGLERDSEIHLITSRVRLHESLIEAVIDLGKEEDQ